MKKTIMSLMLFAGISAIAFAGGKDKSTLKEKVEKNQPVKVYFNLGEIIDEDHEKKVVMADPKGKTDIRTSIPEDFASAELKASLLKQLNEGMQVGGAFAEGDISTIPKSNNPKKHNLDLSKLGDGIHMIVNIHGQYTRFLDVNSGEASHRMEIKAHLFIYEVTAGKLKKVKVNMGMGAFIAEGKAPAIKSDKIGDLGYMETNFPASSVLEDFKRTWSSYPTDFAKRMLKKHDKAIAKRK